MGFHDRIQWVKLTFISPNKWKKNTKHLNAASIKMLRKWSTHDNLRHDGRATIMIITINREKCSSTKLKRTPKKKPIRENESERFYAHRLCNRFYLNRRRRLRLSELCIKQIKNNMKMVSEMNNNSPHWMKNKIEEEKESHAKQMYK